MRDVILKVLLASLFLGSIGQATAAPGLSVLGKDYTFPNRIPGVPSELSEFQGLEINSFKTQDGVTLAGHIKFYAKVWRAKYRFLLEPPP